MAEARRFICDGCGKKIEAWNEGDPYYRNKEGKKVYAYHPSQEHELCIGVDTPTLCLDCGRRFKIDSARPVERCSKCKSENIRSQYSLEGAACPYCKQGTFRQDHDFFVIS
ncbi:MAG: hypothetical protein ACOCX1_00150 [Fimbriimonadaceae bacterium]